MTLTKRDLDEIRMLIDDRLDEKLDEKLTALKSEFFERIDPILKEVLTARDERVLIENRIEKLEEIHPDSKHSLAGI